jgi:hypothetical protein
MSSTATVVKAKDVKVGDVVIKPIAQQCKVLEIRRNSHRPDWIGFIYGSTSYDWYGWFTEDQDVVVVKEAA